MPHTSKQHMKLQQPRNYDFRVSQFDPPRSQSGNDHETTTKVAMTVKRRLLHLAIIERQIITLTTTAKPQQLRVNSREMTTFAASCNDREMQRPRGDKFETAQLLQILRKILCRFMAVVVSSAFWKSLKWGLKDSLQSFCDENSLYKRPRKCTIAHDSRETPIWEPAFGLSLRSRPPFAWVLQGPGPESAPQSACWALLGTWLRVPQRVLFECFWRFLSPKSAKKHSESTLWGTRSQVPKSAQMAARIARLSWSWTPWSSRTS